jgi:hypothetical protein
MLSALESGVVFQSTDLARRSRTVMDAAGKPGGALVRDKSGRTFLIAAVSEVSRDQYALEHLRSAAVAMLMLSRDKHDSLSYGTLSWMAPLSDEHKLAFLEEYLATLQSVSATGPGPVEDLLYDWQQTARVLADTELTARLTADIETPEHPVSV